MEKEFNDVSDKKYELLLDQSIQHKGRTLYRIRALRDFGHHVKKGKLGGFIQSEANLENSCSSKWASGTAWVFHDAKVFDNARVEQDAEVWDRAEVFENAYLAGRDENGRTTQVSDDAKVYGSARITSGSSVGDHAEVFDSVEMNGGSMALGYSKIFENGVLVGTARVKEHAQVFGNAVVVGNCVGASISGNANIYGDCYVIDCFVKENAVVCGTANLRDRRIHISGDAVVDKGIGPGPSTLWNLPHVK